jgi:hypothetical protein
MSDVTSLNSITQNSSSPLRNTEHGERAGGGFITDLLMVSRARSGYIGDMHRSSFMLLVELLSYDRKIEAWEEGQYETLDELRHCETSRRPPDGYNYGPGTPTFRHHSQQKPLPPIEVLNQYKVWHSKSAVTLQPENRKFAIAYYSCPLNSDQALYQFFNRKFSSRARCRWIGQTFRLTLPR